MKNKTKEAQCSFCHKPKSDALLLISGIDGYICETCVEQAYNILNEEMELDSKKDFPKNLSYSVLQTLEKKIFELFR
jgi:ATP-dependent Clp protease ATP-binding subunit ClpX